METLQWASDDVQPMALFNGRCSQNCFWYASRHGLRFAWCLYSCRQEPPFVHAVCLDNEGRAIDPTLGLWATALGTLTLLPDPPPLNPADANWQLRELKRRHEPPAISSAYVKTLQSSGYEPTPERRWWQFWRWF